MDVQPLRGDRSRYEDAFERFDQANLEDPDRLTLDGLSQPKALVYAVRMTDRLTQFAPEASEPLRLAARCQHIRRWTIPRAKFPAGRTGYRLWRKTLSVFHAKTAADILRTVGYDEATVSRVETLLRKDNLKSDQEVQTLEDVACLVFLEHYLSDFTSNRDETTVIDVLGKTWRKMSERGRVAALALDISVDLKTLVTRAVR